MKLRKIFIYILIALPALLTQSCLKDDKDVFDEPSSTRMQEYLSNAKAALVKPDYGWVMEVYPESNQTLGGYNFTVKFDDMYVTAASEIDTGSVKSLYKLTNDMGPVLTFDSYNRILHFLATPWGLSDPRGDDGYEAYHGDFEFVIDSVADDFILLHGKRNDNNVYMRRLTEPAESYLAKAEAMADNMIVTSLSGQVGTGTINGTIDLDNRQLAYQTNDGTTATTAFVYTPTGIRFYKPITVGGQAIDELNYAASTLAFSGTTESGSPVALQGALPEDYRYFADFAGNYRLECDNTSFNVTLTPDKDNNRYLMSGFNDNYDVVLTYDTSLGTLRWNAQAVATAGGYTIWLAAWDSNEGMLTWSPQAGVVLKWNKDKENPVYTFVSNDYTGLTTNSFILWMLDSNGASAGQLNDATYGVNGYAGLQNIKSLTKIN